MILFLIELYLLGCGVALQFREKLPDLFLSMVASLFGLLGYFANIVLLTLVGVRPTSSLMFMIVAIEVLGLFAYRWYGQGKQCLQFKQSQLLFLLGGVVFIGLCWFFLHFARVFASPDSLYMVVMAKSILETGFSQWYFASPLLWGIFVPVMQTLGLLFNDEFTWFIQPVISTIFLLLFLYLSIRASRQIAVSKWISVLLAILGGGIMVSANMYWVAQFYIHTNLNSAISLFLVVASLYLSIKEQNGGWLGIAAIFLIMFGMLRTENVIIASLLIVITVSAQKIDRRKMLATFLPYLVIQALWNVLVIRLNPVAFSNLLSTSQLALVTVGLLGLMVFFVFSNNQWIRERLLPRVGSILVIGILLLVSLVFLANPATIFKFIWANLSTMFSTGQWLTTFWVVIPLLMIVRPKEPIAFQSGFDLIIFGFFGMILMMGALKGSHTSWYDSVNRMYIHILPVMVFYLILRLSSHFSTGITAIATDANDAE